MRKILSGGAAHLQVAKKNQQLRIPCSTCGTVNVWGPKQQKRAVIPNPFPQPSYNHYHYYGRPPDYYCYF
jgi:hypothetical protein